jgi:Helix-turn-helix.
MTYKVDLIRLKKLMVENELEKIGNLSVKAGVDRNTLSKVLRGEQRPSSAVMDKLAKALNIPSQDIGPIFFCKELADSVSSIDSYGKEIKNVKRQSATTTIPI